ncbi:MAG TPA: sugar phosphate nucleotidyltransferase [Candidatus Saccharimonadia bacterium]|nr:sugar phosphate nucleotidyltransferase [Candidatus Saccharimonadia bacterium]
MAQQHEYALILAGGGGTRLWPESRNKTPKQFLKLGAQKTLLRQAAERIKLLVDWDHMYVITNITQYDDVVREVPEIPKDQIICEPQKRETALAMAVGALVIQQRDPEALVMNFASDHVVLKADEFVHVMHVVADAARDGSHLLTVGIMPTFPHTGLGYIKVAGEVSKVDGLPIMKVENFTEKPDAEKAAAFLETKMYFWNANMYTWNVSAIEKAFQAYAPKTAELLAALKPHCNTPEFKAALEKAYAGAEAISIDYAISEKATNLLLVPGDFGWNDVGDWNVVHGISQKDPNGNVILKDAAGNTNGEILLQNTKNSLIEANGRLIALVGLDDVVVIDTKDILLVMNKSKSQDVKKVVEQLKAENKSEYL